MKKKTNDAAVCMTAEELIAKIVPAKISRKTKVILSVFALIPVIVVFFYIIGVQNLNLSDDITFSITSGSSAATTVRHDTISIPAGTVKANPFLPYRTIDAEDALVDVPNFDLVEPPEVLNEGSDAARVMDTIVSGILYDKISPSAILNIEGNDYLVKKGDIVNNYKVMNIEQNSVTVKLGTNTFKAGIGEILTEGSITHNDVSNLSKKFGGEKR